MDCVDAAWVRVDGASGIFGGGRITVVCTNFEMETSRGSQILDILGFQTLLKTLGTSDAIFVFVLAAPHGLASS